MADRLTAAQAAQQGNRDGGGRYAEKEQLDPGVVLDNPARTYIERMIGWGELTPAARDMDPYEAIDSWAAGNQVSVRELQDILTMAGLKLRGTPDQLVDGDLVDLAPVIEEVRGAGSTAHDLVVARNEMATVRLVGLDSDGVPIVHTDLGAWRVPADRELDMMLGHNRCARCGTPAPGRLFCPSCQP